MFSWAFPPETKSRIMRKRKPVTRPMQTQSVLGLAVALIMSDRWWEILTDHDFWPFLGGVG